MILVEKALIAQFTIWLSTESVVVLVSGETQVSGAGTGAVVRTGSKITRATI